MNKTYLLLILLLAVSLRYIGLFWGKIDEKEFDRFQHDEFQHVEIAIKIIQQVDSSFISDFSFHFNDFNAKGLGGQIAWLALPFYKTFPLEARHLLLIGRILSIFYSLMMIVLLYRLGVFMFKSENIGLVAGLLYAIFDLSVTHGRYAIPAVSYGFWVYLGTFQMMILYRNYIAGTAYQFKTLLARSVLLGLSLGMAMSTKYDFIPLLILGLLLIYLIIIKPSNVYYAINIFLLVIGIGLLVFFGSSHFAYSLSDILDSYSILYRENKDVIPVDNHWVNNPILYFFAVVAGSSVFVFALFVVGMIFLIKKYYKEITKPKTLEFAFLLFMVLAEFGIRWAIDTPVIRRANVFMPFVALLASYGGFYFIQHNKWFTLKIRKAILVFTLIYTLGLCLVSQYNFYNEPRYLAADYIKQNIDLPLKIYAPSYATAVGLPPPNEGNHLLADLILFHENFYGRFTKSFTTPFILPNKKEQVFHCYASPKMIQVAQKLVYETGNFVIVKKFSGPEVFPERLLFKYLFGSYEPFNGDLLIIMPKDKPENFPKDYKG